MYASYQCGTERSFYVKKIIILKKAPNRVQICKLENIEHKSMK